MFDGRELLDVLCFAIEIELMFGKRNQKDDVVRIDVDWLLGESHPQPARKFPWFRRSSISLLCILAIVWCWPYASRIWLSWELHRQLTSAMDQQAEDVFPLMLAIHELNPSNSKEMVEQLGSSDPRIRAIANHLLEQTIQQWRQSTRVPANEISNLVDLLSAIRLQTSETNVLRAQLAAQIRPLVTNTLPDSPRLIASIDAILAQADPVSKPRPTSERALITPSTASVDATELRTNNASSKIAIRPPATNPSPEVPSSPAVVAIASGPVLTSMRTLTDQAASTATSKELMPRPIMNLSIPRTVPNTMVVHVADVAAQSVSEQPPAIESSILPQEPTSIKGIEKLELEKLLPLLNSSQTRIARQAFNELIRREFPQSKIELAVALAQGEAEEKLKAMEMIARDTQFDAIPWLVWMAENADRNVRRRAISLLGSMTNPDAMHKLRVLQSREPDSSISEQIDQVLIASRTASSSVR